MFSAQQFTENVLGKIENLTGKTCQYTPKPYHTDRNGGLVKVLSHSIWVNDGLSNWVEFQYLDSIGRPVGRVLGDYHNGPFEVVK